ncbi:MAG: signal peptidase II [Ruminococcaceae bacterium]|nr:signal peptidase II [Oscillospiraceae bacterium]
MILLLAIIVGVIALDQLTKWLTVVYLDYQESFPLWQDVLHLTHHRNEGAAFGILSDQRWVFMLVSTVAIVALTVYLFRFSQKNHWVRISLAMIIGGGIGNMIDRVALGYVIDFIDFTLIDFAIFNVADSFVTVGAFMLMGYLIVEMIRDLKKGKQTPDNATEGDATDVMETSDSDADSSETRHE